MARAETQSELLRALFLHSDSSTDSFELTKKEKDILRNGRNRSSRGPLRVSQQVYSEGTALETLIGYLYLSDRLRLQDVLKKLTSIKDNVSGTDGARTLFNDTPTRATDRQTNKINWQKRVVF